MKFQITLILVITLFTQINAETFHYTVVAKSGLYLRSEMSINSEKITVVPYLTAVEHLGSYTNNKITVEGVEGFWVYVKYRNFKGYLYSGYLYPGFLPYMQISNNHSNFILLDEFGPEYSEIENGKYQNLNFLLVDNFKYWYGVTLEENETTFKKVSINYEFTPQKIQPLYGLLKDGPEYYLPYGDPLPVEFSVEPSNIFNFFIGTNEELRSHCKSQFINDPNGDDIGMFLFPWQQLDINYSQNYIQARARIDQNELSKNSESYLYECFLKRYSSDFELRIPLNDEIFKLPIDVCIMNQSPKILWTGDINSDDVSDFIITPASTREGCGEIFNVVIISNIIENQYEYKIIGDVNWNSITFKNK